MAHLFRFGLQAVQYAKEVADELRKKDYYEGPIPEHYAFRIPFTDRDGKITALSISAVKRVEWGDPDTKVLEIVLIGTDDRCVYISELDYDDVRTFEDIGEVMKEIDRIKGLRSL